MATREIKTRFKLEGEQEFKRAMSDAADATKVLDSEMKLAKAQFEQTGDAQAYAAEQARILKEKIEEQKGAVAAAQAAMDSLAAKGVSESDKTYQMWAKKLNDAQTTLTNLETSFNNVDKLFTLDHAIEVVDSLENKIESLIKGAARLGKALWDSSVEAGQWADTLVTNATEAGLDVETYQAWQFASQFIDTSVDTIVRGRDKLRKTLNDAKEDDLRLFNFLGLPNLDDNGDIKAADRAFWETIDILHNMADAEDRATNAQKLFGNEYRKLMPLIEAGSSAYKDMADKGREVSVVSEKNVNALAATDDAMNELNASLDKAKLDLLASTAPTMQEVADGLSKAVQSFNEFVNSEEGQAALNELNEALSGLIKSFLGEDNGKGTFEAIVNKAKDAVTGFTTALQWIQDNGTAVKGIIEGLLLTWGGLKLTGDVLRFVQGVEAFKGLMGGGGKKAAQSAAEVAASGGAGGHAAALAGSALTRAAAKAETLALAAMAAETAVNVVKEAQEQHTIFGTGPGNTDAEGNWQLGQSGIYINHEIVENAKQKISEAWNSFAESFDLTKSEAAETGKGIYDAITAAVQQGMDAAEFTRKEYGTETLGQFYTARVGELNYTGTGGAAERAEMQSLYEDLTTALEQLQADMTAGGQEAAQNLADAFTEGAPQAVDAVTETTEEIKITTEQGLNDMETLGYNAAIGLANGINLGAVEAIGAANDLARQVYNSIQSALDIHSPSRVLMRMGQFTAEGFAEGIEDGMARVEAATARMGRAAMAEPTYRSGGSWGADPAAGQGSQQSSGGSMNATILMDKTVVGRLVAPIVNETIGAAVASARR